VTIQFEHFLCRPQDHEELFNLRHSELRNVIERAFGATKKKFKMFRQPSNFSVRTQARIIMACGIIHNFIRIHDPDDADLDLDMEMDDGGLDSALRGDIDPDELSAGISPNETEWADARRDNIARAMWASYQAELQRRAM
jgi:hypothetical protein